MGTGTSSGKATAASASMAQERATPVQSMGRYGNLSDEELQDVEMDLQSRWMMTRSQKAKDSIQEELSEIYNERMRRRGR